MLLIILQNIAFIAVAVASGWLMLRNIRWQMESEDTDADDKK